VRIEPDGDGITFVMQSGDSPELCSIVTGHLPAWVELFARKNADYGSFGESAGVLGIRGQYADIWRKMAKLKRSMWDGERLEFEGTEEVINDLIGHLFLTLYMMRVREQTDREHAFSDDSTDVFVDRFIAELGGPEQALRVGGILSEALSSRVVARCQQMAAERAPRGDAGFAEESYAEYDAEQNDLGEVPGITDWSAVKRARLQKYAAQEVLDDTAYDEVILKAAYPNRQPRITSVLENGITRYYHEPADGGDREELVLVPERLLDGMAKAQYIARDGLNEIANFREAGR
jgi:hypothetical protein